MFLSYLWIKVGTNPDRPRPGRLWLRNRYHVHQRLCMAFPQSDRKRNDPYFLKPFRWEDFPITRHKADQDDDVVGAETLKVVHAPRAQSEGFLFRIDPAGRGRVLITVLSTLEPDWNYAFQNSPFLADRPRVRRYQPQFKAGERYLFRLEANPTMRLPEKSNLAKEAYRLKWVGDRIPVPRERLEEWIHRKAEAAGFKVLSLQPLKIGYAYMNKFARPELEDGEENSPEQSREPKSINDQEKGQEESKREKPKRELRGVNLFSVDFCGELEVTDPDRFLLAVRSGIGPAKAFGFGLLTLKKATTGDGTLS